MTGNNNSNGTNNVHDDTVFQLLSKKTQSKIYNTFYNYLKETGEQFGQDQPFYTIDIADILWKAQIWKDNFPNVVPYYAVKANSDPVLLRLFVLLGYGFDCSTEGEIRLVMKAQGDPKKVIFAHTVKTRHALDYAAAIGCELLTFDSKEELMKIREHYPKAKLILRLKSASVQNVYNLSLKFGCEESEAEELLLAAKQFNLNVVGVSFHVGSLCEDPKTFTSTIENSRLVFETAKRIGYEFTIVDIGAGFFGSKEKEDFFYKLSQKINDSLKENFPDRTTQFIAEPGCYYVCSAVTLTTAILGKKRPLKKEKNENVIQVEYFVNDGFYGAFFEHKELYDVKPKPLLNESEMRGRGVCRTRVWGQTCCSEDLVVDECSLPEMEEGEWIVWENMGAYSKGVSSTFTEVKPQATKHVFIRNDRLRLDWIANLEDLIEYISEVTDLVDSGCISEVNNVY